MVGYELVICRVPALSDDDPERLILVCLKLICIPPRMAISRRPGRQHGWPGDSLCVDRGVQKGGGS